MTADLSRECRELYRMFSQKVDANIDVVRVDLGKVSLTEQEMIDYLMRGRLTEKITAQLLLDKQPAKDDN